MFNAILADPAAFGFSNTSTPCVTGNLQDGGTVCADPELVRVLGLGTSDHRRAPVAWQCLRRCSGRAGPGAGLACAARPRHRSGRRGTPPPRVFSSLIPGVGGSVSSAGYTSENSPSALRTLATVTASRRPRSSQNGSREEGRRQMRGNALAALMVIALLQPARSQEPNPIIDMHVHAGPTDEARKTILTVMDELKIERAFLSGSMSDVERWAAASPRRFIASPMFPVFGIDGFPGTDQLRTEYRAGRLEGMGEITSQYIGMAPDSPALEPYFALAEELDLPVLIHMGGLGVRREGFRSAAGRPLLLEDVVVKHPKLRVYLENAGYPFLGDIIALLHQYPLVYADVSTITWLVPREAFYDYLGALVRAGFANRIMFGSDAAPQRPDVIRRGVEAVQAAPFLTQEQKRDIFYNNAVRFLRTDTKSK